MNRLSNLWRLLLLAFSRSRIRPPLPVWQRIFPDRTSTKGAIGKRMEGKIKRITPSLPFKLSILPRPSPSPSNKTPDILSPSILFKSLLTTKMKRPNPIERRKIDLLPWVLPQGLNRGVHIKKLQSSVRSEPILRLTTHRWTPFPPPSFIPDSQGRGDIFNALLLSLKRCVGG